MNHVLAILTVPFLDQPSPMLAWVLAALAAVIIGLAKSGFGGGIGIIAVLMMIFAVGDAPVAVGLMLPLLIVGDVFSVFHHWGTWRWAVVVRLIPGFVAGVAVGTLLIYLFQRLDAVGRGLELAVGAVCIAYVVVDFAKSRWGQGWQLENGWGGGTGAGAAAGFASMLAHTAGPVITMYLLAQNLARQTFIGTAVMYALLGNSIKLVPYAGLDLIDWSTLWMGLWLVPLVPLGTWIGAWLNRRMNEQLFKRAILIIVLLSGFYLLIGGSTIQGWIAAG